MDDICATGEPPANRIMRVTRAPLRLPTVPAGTICFMAVVQRSDRVTTMWWFEVPWVCGRLAGTRHVRAPDARSAAHDLEQHPSDYGLAHENVIVGRAVRLEPVRRTAAA